MILTDQELQTVERITNSHVVRHWGLLWNIRMVAAANEVTETKVLEGIRNGVGIKQQLTKPYHGSGKSQDLNKRKDVVILSQGGVDFSWNFCKFMEYMNDPTRYHSKQTNHRSMYNYWLVQMRQRQHTASLFMQWLDQYLQHNNHRYAIAGPSTGESKWDVLRHYWSLYQNFDKNKLRHIRVTKAEAIEQIARLRQEPDPYARFYLLSPKYHELMVHLPKEHVPEMVRFMLEHQEYQWLPET